MEKGTSVIYEGKLRVVHSMNESRIFLTPRGVNRITESIKKDKIDEAIKVYENEEALGELDTLKKELEADGTTSLPRADLELLLQDKGIDLDTEAAADELGITIEEDEGGEGNGGNNGGDEGNGGEEDDVSEDINKISGIPPQGKATYVDKLPSPKSFLQERKIERQICENLNVGDKFTAIGDKQVSVVEEENPKTDEPKPNEPPVKDKEPAKTKEEPEKQDDPKVKEVDVVDIKKGDNLEIVDVDPTNRKVIAKFGDKKIELDAKDFVEKDKGGVLEQKEGEDDGNGGDNGGDEGNSGEKIDNKEEFAEYVNKILKKAHGEEFDQEIATKMIDDIAAEVEKGDLDWGGAVGKVQASLD